MSMYRINTPRGGKRTPENGANAPEEHRAAAENQPDELATNWYSSAIALKIMHKMGYEEGSGLGRKNQGIRKPIQSGMIRGRQGLGYGNLESVRTDLVNANTTEEERIKAMIAQSSQEYDPCKYLKSCNITGHLPLTSTGYRCGKQGHCIKNCPTNNLDVKRSIGIPVISIMVPVDGPAHKVALRTSSGDYTVPLFDHQTYKEVKKEKPQFVPQNELLAEPKSQIPKEIFCMICKDLLQDAVLIPCCGYSFCDECVRQVLLESDNHECPECHKTNVSPNTLIPNRSLRTAVLNFKNETNYTRVQKIALVKSFPTHIKNMESLQPSSDSTVKNQPKHANSSPLEIEKLTVKEEIVSVKSEISPPSEEQAESVLANADEDTPEPIIRLTFLPLKINLRQSLGEDTDDIQPLDDEPPADFEHQPLPIQATGTEQNQSERYDYRSGNRYNRNYRDEYHERYKEETVSSEPKPTSQIETSTTIRKAKLFTRPGPIRPPFLHQKPHRSTSPIDTSHIAAQPPPPGVRPLLPHAVSSDPPAPFSKQLDETEDSHKDAKKAEDRSIDHKLETFERELGKGDREYSRDRSRSRNQSSGQERSRTLSRTRSYSSSKSWTRTYCRRSSRSRSRSRSPLSSRSRSRSYSPSRSRSWSKQRSYTRSRSRKRTESRSRSRSQAEPRFRTRVKSRDRVRSPRPRSHSRSYSPRNFNNSPIRNVTFAGRHASAENFAAPQFGTLYQSQYGTSSVVNIPAGPDYPPHHVHFIHLIQPLRVVEHYPIERLPKCPPSYNEMYPMYYTYQHPRYDREQRPPRYEKRQKCQKDYPRQHPDVITHRIPGYIGDTSRDYKPRYRQARETRKENVRELPQTPEQEILRIVHTKESVEDSSSKKKDEKAVIRHKKHHQYHKCKETKKLKSKIIVAIGDEKQTETSKNLIKVEVQPTAKEKIPVHSRKYQKFSKESSQSQPKRIKLDRSNFSKVDEQSAYRAVSTSSSKLTDRVRDTRDRNLERNGRKLSPLRNTNASKRTSSRGRRYYSARRIERERDVRYNDERLKEERRYRFAEDKNIHNPREFISHDRNSPDRRRHVMEAPPQSHVRHYDRYNVQMERSSRIVNRRKSRSRSYDSSENPNACEKCVRSEHIEESHYQRSTWDHSHSETSEMKARSKYSSIKPPEKHGNDFNPMRKDFHADLMFESDYEVFKDVEERESKLQRKSASPEVSRKRTRFEKMPIESSGRYLQNADKYSIASSSSLSAYSESNSSDSDDLRGSKSKGSEAEHKQKHKKSKHKKHKHKKKKKCHK